MSEERELYAAEADGQPDVDQDYAASVRALTIQLAYLPAQIKAAQLAHLEATSEVEAVREAVERARRELELVTAQVLTEAYASGDITGKNEAERKRAEMLYLDNHSAVTDLVLALDDAEARLRGATRVAADAEIEVKERVNAHRSALADAEMLAAYLRYLAGRG